MLRWNVTSRTFLLLATFGFSMVAFLVSVGTVDRERNSSLSFETPLQQEFASPSPFETDGFQIRESELWKTYRNSGYDFEFQYPSAWTLTEHARNPAYQTYSHFITLRHPSRQYTMYFEVFPNLGYNSPQEYVEKERERYRKLQVSGIEPSVPLAARAAYPVRVGAYEGYELDGVSSLNGSYEDEWIALIKGEWLYTIRFPKVDKYPTLSNTQENHDLARQVLSSWKFFNQGNGVASPSDPWDTSQWRTHRQDDLKIEFKYPPDWAVDPKYGFVMVNNFESKYPPQNIVPEGGVEVTINRYAEPIGFEVENLLEWSTPLDVRVTSVSELPATRVRTREIYQSGIRVISDIILFEYQSMTYWIRLAYREEDEQASVFRSVFEGILSTIKTL